MNDAAYFRNLVLSIGEDGWWFVVRGVAIPVSVEQSNIRVSPTWEINIEHGVAGCQKGVGVGVEIMATLHVLPPLNRFRPPIIGFVEMLGL